MRTLWRHPARLTGPPAEQDIQKNNKKLKGTNVGLVSMRKQFEYVRACFAAKRGTWLAMDFEGWERDHNLLTEFGYSQLTWVAGEPCLVEGHTVPKENSSYRNGYFVVDARHNYEFGETRTTPLAQWKQEIHDLISQAAEQGPLFLVFHDKRGDIEYVCSAHVYLRCDRPPYCLAGL